MPETLTVHIDSKDESDTAIVYTFSVEGTGGNLAPTDYEFIQTEALTKAGIGVQKYGALLIPESQNATEITLVVKCGSETYTAQTTISGSNTVGDTVSLRKN